MNHYQVKITDAGGTRTWNIIAATSIKAARTALNFAQISGPFFMITKRAN
ncbi:MAG TPA: hypothetical protein VIH29_11990 [Gallionella sp.]